MSKLKHRYRNIFIVGLPGVGKTVFGRSYAAHTGRTFVDLDRVIEFEQGQSIPQIFERDGEKEFREIERHTLQKLARRQNIVLALGGGAFCNPDAVRLLSEHGLIVCLHDENDRLAKRIFDEKEKRPLFAEVETVEQARIRLEEILAQRQDWYQKAHLTLDLRFSSVDAAKIELSTYEDRAFSPVYCHELEKLGEKMAAAPDIQVHMRPRYVLQERPYLAIFSEKATGRVVPRSGAKKKNSGSKKPLAAKTTKGPKSERPGHSQAVETGPSQAARKNRKPKPKGSASSLPRSSRRPEAGAPGAKGKPGPDSK